MIASASSVQSAGRGTSSAGSPAPNPANHQTTHRRATSATARSTGQCAAPSPKAGEHADARQPAEYVRVRHQHVFQHLFRCDHYALPAARANDSGWSGARTRVHRYWDPSWY